MIGEEDALTGEDFGFADSETAFTVEGPTDDTGNDVVWSQETYRLPMTASFDITF